MRCAFGFAGGDEVELEPQPAHEVASSLGSALAPLPARGNPVWLRNLDDDQWLTTLDRAASSYLGYRLTTGHDRRAAERLLRLAHAAAVRRVVVDVRLNHGGNNRTYGPLLDALSRPAISRKLVAAHRPADILRGRELHRRRRPRTRRRGSSASWRAALRASGATRRPVDLRSAGLTVRVATMYQDFGPPETRARPDVLVEPTAADFLAGRDPVLARALALP